MPLVRYTPDASTDWAADLAAEPLVIVYKHSPTCGLCDIAIDEVEAFLETRPATDVRLVDVLAQRPLSNAMERSFGIRHESPQAIVLRHGTPVWHGSHRRVTAAQLATAIAAAPDGAERAGSATPGHDTVSPPAR